MPSCIFSFIKVVVLHSYKCLAADHSDHAVLQLVITVFHAWNTWIMGPGAWIYVHIFSTFSPVKCPKTNKDLTRFSRKSTFPVQGGYSLRVIPPVPLIHGLFSVWDCVV